MATQTLEELLRMTVMTPEHAAKIEALGQSPNCMADDPRGNFTPEFRVTVHYVHVIDNGQHGVNFIIHADGYDSDTLAFNVIGDELTRLYQ